MSTSAVAVGKEHAHLPSNRFQVLALSGGGYRGLYTAKILADVEQHIGGPIGRHFDLIAGTSIGGILALGVALEIPAEEMVELFEKHGEQIFKKRMSLFGIARAPYSQNALAELLANDKVFGQRKLESCIHPVILPAINYSTGLPVVFKTPHHVDFVRDLRYTLVDVALATSAAPGYFPRHVFDNRQYIDGGLFANAPGLLALHEAQHFLGRPREEVCMVSIGTMSSRFTVDPRRNRSGGTYDWGGGNPAATPKRLFSIAISAQESLVHNMLGHQLEHYYHVDDALTDERAGAVALDKANAAAREVLLGSGAERAKWCLGDPKFREYLQHSASTPVFYHGQHAGNQGGGAHAHVA
jgi:uncharacterized protein